MYHYNCRSSIELVTKHYKEPKQRASQNGVTKNQSYYDWLKEQPKDVQEMALGKARAKLFQNMTAEKFKRLQFDKNFEPLTLKEMEKLEPVLFKQAFKTASPLNDGSLQESIQRLLPSIKNLTRENSMEFRKQNAIGQKWAVANISNDVQKQLRVKTNEVWLSDDTLIKMMAHHPELDLLPLFKNVQNILDNAVKVVKKDDLNVVYFTHKDRYFIATIKATKDKSELYLTTVYTTLQKEFERQLKKHK